MDGKTKEQFDNDPYMQGVIGLLERQFEKGVKTYGAPLSQNPKELTLEELFDYLSEELIDGLVYIQGLKAAMKRMGVGNGKFPTSVQ